MNNRLLKRRIYLFIGLQASEKLTHTKKEWKIPLVQTGDNS